MKNGRLRTHACLPLVLLLFLACPVSLHASWGMEVGRANSGDVASLISDWNAFKMERNRINRVLMGNLGIERQKQLLGVTGDIDAKQLFEEVQTYWLMKVLPPYSASRSTPRRRAPRPSLRCQQCSE